MIEPTKLTPFKHFCVTIGEIPSSYLESMTYYELLNWFCDYLQNTVIPAVNTNAEAVEEIQTLFIQLKNYVDTYFDNLDVQEEVNKKLDEMVEDGTLYDVINTQIFRDINTDISNLEEQLGNTNENLLGTNNQVSSNTSRITALENQIPSIVGGNPKGVYADLTALETALPDGATGIYITADDGHWYYYLTGTGWTDGGVYQTTGVADGSITPSKLNAILKNSIHNTHIYCATNTVKKVDLNNSNKKYTISFDKTNVYILSSDMSVFTVIGVLAQTNLEIPNGYALVINKATAFAGTPTQYTPVLVEIAQQNFQTFFNENIILWYNANGVTFGIMTTNLPLDNKKTSKRKVSIYNSVLTFFNKTNTNWIGTNIAKVTSGSNSYIQFTGSNPCTYNDTTNNMVQASQLLMYSGEWTAVFKEDYDGSDFVGGGHGYESITDFKLFIDGSVYDITQNLGVTDYENIQIICKSNVYSRQDNEVLCEKILFIDIQDTIKIRTKIIWKKATTLYFEYLNMLPVSRYEHANPSYPYVTNKGFNDTDYTSRDYADTSFTPTHYEGATYFELFNNSTGYQYRASIKINNKTELDGNYGYVNNGSLANKIYFNYGPEHNTVAVNEVHESECEVVQVYSGLVS